MAGNVQIAIKDEQAAKEWLAKVQDIDTDYLKAMTDATESLANIEDFADGTMVDELVNYANGLCNAAEKTFNAIDAIAGTVSEIVSLAEKFKSEALSCIGKLANTILNL